MNCLGPTLRLTFALAGSPVMQAEHVVGVIQKQGCYCIVGAAEIESVTLDPAPDCWKGIESAKGKRILHRDKLHGKVLWD